MNPPLKQPVAPSTKPALELIALARLSPEVARQNLRALLLANPNYFGNVTGSSFKAVLNIHEDTTYESIGAIGYDPQLERLRAIINIKRSRGYSGDITTRGSEEYVRFYLSYDDGSTWYDQGSRAFKVFDSPGPKPLEFAVTLQITPRNKFCFVQHLARVRAILSWNSPPPAGAPNWTPVWGNVVESQIQIDGSHFILRRTALSTDLERPEDLAHALDLEQSTEAAAPKKLSPFELHMLYAKRAVPQHRYLSPMLARAANLSGRANLSAVLSKDTNSASNASGLDLSRLVETWLDTRGDTAFEALSCLGFDLDTNQLTAIIDIKQNAGYCGGFDTAGSNEFVAFWVDWGSGWDYAGTTSVAVHDSSPLPVRTLRYSVVLSMDLLPHRKTRKDSPHVAKVRAVLSWGTPPSTTNPYARVVWGNSVEGLVLNLSKHTSALTEAGDIDLEQVRNHGNDDCITNAVTISPGARRVDTYGMGLRGHPLAIGAWDRTNVNSGQTSNYNQSSAGFCLQTGS